MGGCCSRKSSIIPYTSFSKDLNPIKNDLLKENLQSKDGDEKPPISLVKGIVFKTSKMRQKKPRMSRMGQGPTAIRGIVIGHSGSGKDFVCAEIKNDYELTYLSMEHELRQAMQSGSVFTEDEKRRIQDVKFIENPMLMKVVKSALDNRKNKEFLIDGFPKTIDQAKLLDEMLIENNEPLTIVIYLKLNDTTLAERLKGRFQHPSSGRIYQLNFNPPKVEGKDDATGEPLVQIPDDTNEMIQQKAQDFRTKMQPVIDYYGSREILKEIDASCKMDKLLSIISKTILRLKFK